MRIHAVVLVLSLVLLTGCFHRAAPVMDGKEPQGQHQPDSPGAGGATVTTPRPTDGGLTAAGEGGLAYLLKHMAPFAPSAPWYELGNDLLRLPPPSSDAAVIPSFQEPVDSPAWAVLTQYGRVMTYDAAVESIALALAGRKAEATRLLRALVAMQLPDGSLGFSWNSTDDTFYNRSYRRCGTVAWAAYAALLVDQANEGDEFRAFAVRATDWLLKQRVPVDRADDPRRGLIKGGSGRWSADYQKLTKGDLSWVSTEHNIDCFFLLEAAARVVAPEQARRYRQAAAEIRTALTERLWSTEEGRFYQGAQVGETDRGQALDCCTWGALFLHAIGDDQRAAAALDTADRVFQASLAPAGATAGWTITGYRPYAGVADETDWDQYPDLVWAEGSLGAALAHLRLGRRERYQKIVGEVLKLCAEPGRAASGVRYSRYQTDRDGTGGDVGSDDFVADFTRAPSAGATAWLVLVVQSAVPGNEDRFWGRVASP